MQEGRAARYKRIYEQLEGLIAGRSPNLTAAMATICAVLHAKMRHHSWTGFYLVAGPDELHIGPYQGPVACQILRGGGICLECVRTRSPIVVADATSFPGHIACDPRSRSEIALPVFRGRDVGAVLDIDSRSPAQFDVADLEPLRTILSLLEPYLGAGRPSDER